MSQHLVPIEDDPFFKSLVQNIKLAKKRGCSSNEIADALGRPEFIIERWLKGTHRPTTKMDMLEALKKIEALLKSKVKA